MAKRIMIRQWRVSTADPSGLHVWFDPACEELRLYALDPPKDEGVANALERGDQNDMFAPDQVHARQDSPDDLPF